MMFFVLMTQAVAEIVLREGSVQSASADGGFKIVTGSVDFTVKVWDGTNLTTLEGHTDLVNGVAVTPDGSKIVSGSDDFTVRVWDMVTGENLQTLKGHTYVSSVAVTPDGSKIVSGSADKTVKVWDMVTGENLQTLEGHKDFVTSVAVTPDGSKIVSGSYDRTVKVWDMVTGENLQTLKGHTSGVNSVAVTPDGSKIVSGSFDNTVRVWDMVTGENLQTLKGHIDSVLSVAVTPDGSKIVSSSGSFAKTVRVWDMVTGENLQTLKGHRAVVGSVAVTPDGSKVVSGSDDNTVRVWDMVTGENLQTLQESDAVTSVAVAPLAVAARAVLQVRVDGSNVQPEEVAGKGASDVTSSGTTGESVRSVPEEFVVGGKAFFATKLTDRGSVLELECGKEAGSDGCTFLVSVYRCPPCSSGKDGGYAGSLPGAGLQPRRCAPLFTAGGVQHPMAGFLAVLDAGDVVTLPPSTSRTASLVVLGVQGRA